MIQVYQKPLVGKNIGVVFGSFAPLHQGHLDAILRAYESENLANIVASPTQTVMDNEQADFSERQSVKKPQILTRLLNHNTITSVEVV